MQLVAVGVSHNSAPVSLRERLTVPPESLPHVLRELRESVAEALVLSTCNRIELYAVAGHEGSGSDVLRQFLATHGDVPMRVIRDATYAHGHESAVRHLLRVAAGLDSMVLGESEILGQVRRALMAARDAGTLGPVLDRLGDAALACGKRTRSATTLGRDGESVASVAVRLAAREHGGLDRAKVVVIGAGDTARSALAALATTGARITVVNRTYDRAAALASEHGGEALPWSELGEALASADVVIACTGAAVPVVETTTLSRSRGARGTPFLCVDLGVPRAIEPAVTSLAGVRLIDVDRVELEAAARRAGRARDLARADAIVEQETERYMEWWRGRGVAATISRLHAQADAIREAEVERALAKLPGLDARGRAVVLDLASRVVGKLLREPTLALKRDPEGVNMALVVERLFALGDSGDYASGRCDGEERALSETIHQESRVS